MKKDPNVVYIKPKRIQTTLTQIGEMIQELLLIYKDRDFFYQDNHKDWKDLKVDLINRSTDPTDLKRIQQDDVERICRDVIQVSLFGRIIETDEEGIPINLPKLHFPMFMKQFLSSGREMDFYDMSSYKTHRLLDEMKKRTKDETKKSK
tara:strand:- start:3110 stop:3556 length:447 start_codon:yes stop_codon:yes gene_type:complete